MYLHFVVLTVIICLDMTLSQALVYASQPMAVITTGNGKTNRQPATLDTNADYSRKVNVRVSDILTRQQAAEAATFGFKSFVQLPEKAAKNIAHNNRESTLPRAQIFVRPQNSPPANALTVPLVSGHNVLRDDRSWPPEHSQDFTKVSVRVMGQKLDTKALLHLTPSSDPASIKKLKKILGSEFQTEWMSVDTPEKSSGKITRSVIHTLPKIEENLQEAVERLNFTIFRQSLTSEHPTPITMSAEQVTFLKDWLLQRASCKMEFIWEDLGSLFWPRWIRRGICINSNPCSWPPGMKCRPSGSKSLKLLRWACSDDSNQGRHYQKRWLRDQLNPHTRRSRRDGFASSVRRRFTREERRSKRARRLIRRLSLTANGYHCEWHPHEFLVTDKCSCSCE